MASDRVVLIGEGDLADETEAALEAIGAAVTRLDEPSDDDVEEALKKGTAHVAIVSRNDAYVLRMALMVRYVDDEIPLLVTVFEPPIAEGISDSISNCTIASMADIVAPSLAGPCLSDDLVAVNLEADPPAGIRETDDGVEEVALDLPKRKRVRGGLRALLQPYDKSAVLLLLGAFGLLGILLIETFGAMLVLGQGFVDALYGAGKTIVTVDPNKEVDDGPKAFKLFITFTMLLALVLEVCFTAGLVNRLIDRRLTGIVGHSVVPRRDHVVVIGMGQVGLRLCLALRRCGIGVVAVDNEEEGAHVSFARDVGLPVVIGRGADPALLRSLTLKHARALAAVTDDDLQNISIAMAAKSVNPDLRIVVRAGDGKLANETRSLFRIGLVRDVHRIAAALLAAQITGAANSDTRVVCRDDDAHLLHADGRLEPAKFGPAG